MLQISFLFTHKIRGTYLSQSLFRHLQLMLFKMLQFQIIDFIALQQFRFFLYFVFIFLKLLWKSEINNLRSQYLQATFDLAQMKTNDLQKKLDEKNQSLKISTVAQSINGKIVVCECSNVKQSAASQVHIFKIHHLSGSWPQSPCIFQRKNYPRLRQFVILNKEKQQTRIFFIKAVGFMTKICCYQNKKLISAQKQRFLPCELFISNSGNRISFWLQEQAFKQIGVVEQIANQLKPFTWIRKSDTTHNNQIEYGSQNFINIIEMLSSTSMMKILTLNHYIDWEFKQIEDSMHAVASLVNYNYRYFYPPKDATKFLKKSSAVVLISKEQLQQKKSQQWAQSVFFSSICSLRPTICLAKIISNPLGPVYLQKYVFSQNFYSQIEKIYYLGNITGYFNKNVIRNIEQYLTFKSRISTQYLLTQKGRQQIQRLRNQGRLQIKKQQFQFLTLNQNQDQSSEESDSQNELQNQNQKPNTIEKQIEKLYSKSKKFYVQKLKEQLIQRVEKIKKEWDVLERQRNNFSITKIVIDQFQAEIIKRKFEVQQFSNSCQAGNASFCISCGYSNCKISSQQTQVQQFFNMIRFGSDSYCPTCGGLTLKDKIQSLKQRINQQSQQHKISEQQKMSKTQIKMSETEEHLNEKQLITKTSQKQISTALQQTLQKQDKMSKKQENGSITQDKESKQQRQQLNGTQNKRNHTQQDLILNFGKSNNINSELKIQQLQQQIPQGNNQVNNQTLESVKIQNTAKVLQNIAKQKQLVSKSQQNGASVQSQQIEISTQQSNQKIQQKLLKSQQSMSQKAQIQNQNQLAQKNSQHDRDLLFCEKHILAWYLMIVRLKNQTNQFVSADYFHDSFQLSYISVQLSAEENINTLTIDILQFYFQKMIIYMSKVNQNNQIEQYRIPFLKQSAVLLKKIKYQKVSDNVIRKVIHQCVKASKAQQNIFCTENQQKIFFTKLYDFVEETNQICSAKVAEHYRAYKKSMNDQYRVRQTQLKEMIASFQLNLKNSISRSTGQFLFEIQWAVLFLSQYIEEKVLIMQIQSIYLADQNQLSFFINEIQFLLNLVATFVHSFNQPGQAKFMEQIQTQIMKLVVILIQTQNSIRQAQKSFQKMNFQVAETLLNDMLDHFVQKKCCDIKIEAKKLNDNHLARFRVIFNQKLKSLKVKKLFSFEVEIKSFQFSLTQTCLKAHSNKDISLAVNFEQITQNSQQLNSTKEQFSSLVYVDKNFVVTHAQQLMIDQQMITFYNLIGSVTNKCWKKQSLQFKSKSQAQYKIKIGSVYKLIHQTLQKYQSMAELTLVYRAGNTILINLINYLISQSFAINILKDSNYDLANRLKLYVERVRYNHLKQIKSNTSLYEQIREILEFLFKNRNLLFDFQKQGTFQVQYHMIVQIIILNALPLFKIQIAYKSQLKQIFKTLNHFDSLDGYNQIQDYYLKVLAFRHNKSKEKRKRQIESKKEKQQERD